MFFACRTLLANFPIPGANRRAPNVLPTYIDTFYVYAILCATNLVVVFFVLLDGTLGNSIDFMGAVRTSNHVIKMNLVPRR